MTTEELNNTVSFFPLLKVNQLKELCKSIGLALKGKKQDLLDRLVQYTRSCYAAGENVRLLAVRTVVLKMLNNDPIPDFQNLFHALQTGLIDLGLISVQNNRLVAHSTTAVRQRQTVSNGSANVHSPMPQLYGSTYYPKYTGPLLLFPSTMFYSLLRMVHGFPFMMIASKGRNVANIPVHLTQQEVLQLNLSPNTKLYLFSGLSSSPDPSHTHIQFPPIEIHVDGINTKQYVKGLKGKPGTCRPADLSPYIRDLSRQFTINIVYSDAAEPYIVYLYIVNVSSPERLIEDISTKERITAQSTRRDIQREYDLNQDDEIVMATSSISLRCPLTYARMKYPVKSTKCEHVQCFDGLSFLTMQERIPSWICPICSAVIDSQLLAVSNYLKEILDSTSEDVDTVTLNPDGSWEAVNEDDTKHAGQQSPNSSREATAVPESASHTTHNDSIEIVSIDSESEDEQDVTMASTAQPSHLPNVSHESSSNIARDRIPVQDLCTVEPERPEHENAQDNAEIAQRIQETEDDHMVGVENAADISVDIMEERLAPPADATPDSPSQRVSSDDEPIRSYSRRHVILDNEERVAMEAEKGIPAKRAHIESTEETGVETVDIPSKTLKVAEPGKENSTHEPVETQNEVPGQMEQPAPIEKTAEQTVPTPCDPSRTRNENATSTEGSSETVLQGPSLLEDANTDIGTSNACPGPTRQSSIDSRQLSSGEKLPPLHASPTISLSPTPDTTPGNLSTAKVEPKSLEPSSSVGLRISTPTESLDQAHRRIKLTPNISVISEIQLQYSRSSSPQPSNPANIVARPAPITNGDTENRKIAPEGLIHNGSSNGQISPAASGHNSPPIVASKPKSHIGDLPFDSMTRPSLFSLTTKQPVVHHSTPNIPMSRTFGGGRPFQAAVQPTVSAQRQIPHLSPPNEAMNEAASNRNVENAFAYGANIFHRNTLENEIQRAGVDFTANGPRPHWSPQLPTHNLPAQVQNQFVQFNPQGESDKQVLMNPTYRRLVLQSTLLINIYNQSMERVNLSAQRNGWQNTGTNGATSPVTNAFPTQAPRRLSAPQDVLERTIPPRAVAGQELYPQSRFTENAAPPEISTPAREVRYSKSAFDIVRDASRLTGDVNHKVKGILGIEVVERVVNGQTNTTTAQAPRKRSEASILDNSMTPAFLRTDENTPALTVSPIDNRIQNMSIETPMGKKRTMPVPAVQEKTWNKRLSRQGSKKFDPSEINQHEVIELDD